MSIFINFNNAEKSLEVLHTFFANQEIQKQAQITLPKSIKPFSTDHYLYLFYSCLINYGMKSSTLHENLLKFYEHSPEYFVPSNIVHKYSYSYFHLAELLRLNIHVRYPNECARRWLALSVILNSQYNGNPQEMFKDKTTYYEFKEEISKIKGFGQKTGGLLLRMLIDNKMLNPIDGISEIPIDRHDIDLSIWLRVIAGATADEIKRNNKLIKSLSDTWVEASNKLLISPSLADQYLWIIGSQFCTSQRCFACPLKGLCVNEGIDT